MLPEQAPDPGREDKGTPIVPGPAAEIGRAGQEDLDLSNAYLPPRAPDEAGRTTGSASRQAGPTPARDPSGLPLPPRVPGNFVRQLGQLREDFLGYLERAARYGDVARLHPLPFKDIYLVSHPELVRRVLVDDAASYTKSSQTKTMVGKFLGNGLVLSEGSEHKSQRAILQPAFTPRATLARADSILAATNEAVERWIAAGRVELRGALKELTLDIVARASFGCAKLDDSDAIGSAMRTFEHAISGRFRSMPLPDWIPTRKNREDRAAIRLMDQAVTELIATGTKSGSHAAAPNALDALLEAHSKGLIDRDGVRDQLVTIFFAGHETIANLMLWAIYEAAIDPRVGQRLREESQRVAPDGQLQGGDIGKLVFAEQALRETLRLYPSAWVFDRSPKRDVELGGFRIPAGATVFVSPYVVQRDPRWFPDPTRWDPERFTADASGRTLEERLPRLAYFPFGAGPRFCLGYSMAMLEGKAILSTVFGNCDVQLADVIQRPVPDPSATLGMKDPLHVLIGRTAAG